MRNILDVVWTLAKLVLIAGLIALGSCTMARTLLKQAPTELPEGWQPDPRALLPEELARSLLQTEIYGDLSLVPGIAVRSSAVLSGSAVEGLGTLTQWQLKIGYGAAERRVDLVLVMPNAHPSAPVILSQNFCPNDDVVPLPGVAYPSDSSFDCAGGGLFGSLMTGIFGRYIVTPPLQTILERGYGFAALYPSQLIPDSAEDGMAVLDAMFPAADNRPGALAVWSQLFGIAAELIEEEQGSRPFIAYGHSRFAKTALLAGAWSDRIDGVIAHQSGTLGASSVDDEDGEPVSALLSSYPHWAGPGLERHAGNPSALPVDPADLLNMLGDKPVLLGNARRDVWSDPWGAFKEAKRAWGEDFTAARPGDFDPAARKAYWLRPGTHGVVKEDWPAFLAFLDAHFGKAQ
ncbi:hypothetical protein [uncultured Algimonas sp.]|uniref:hypothetical protein n=1 Tax=uncultured Algimonas sp. TaxID=1547920 RepID=UPI002624D22B|nr:hypothetical protein [uncultured Algimonas sp.]